MRMKRGAYLQIGAFITCRIDFTNYDSTLESGHTRNSRKSSLDPCATSGRLRCRSPTERRSADALVFGRLDIVDENLGLYRDGHSCGCGSKKSAIVGVSGTPLHADAPTPGTSCAAIHEVIGGRATWQSDGRLDILRSSLPAVSTFAPQRHARWDNLFFDFYRLSLEALDPR